MKKEGLESIVPSPSLCRKIPAGEFIDSALVWMHRTALDGISDEPFSVTNRLHADYCKREYFPAPTLAEILKAFPKKDKHENKLRICPFGLCDVWGIGYNYKDVICNDENPADAALRLWLKLKGEEL